VIPPPATTAIQIRTIGNLGKRPPSAPAEPRTHVVQPGETLYGIAEKYYSDSTQWKKIRDANKTRIDPIGNVRAGQILVIP